MATASARPPRRVFYVAGPGDAIHAHNSWKAGVQDPTEVSLTFSGQIEDYCRDIGASLHIVSYHKRKERIEDGSTIIEHLPKPWPDAAGAAYHLRELAYGLQLLQRARKFRADTAILDSGCTHFFWQGLFHRAGMQVVPVLHNALWPNNYKPQNAMAKLIRGLDRPFFRKVPLATLCVSPLCARQVEELAGDDSRPRVQIRAQFDGAYFAKIPPPPPHAQRPFRIMFIGRVVEAKGVFDILEMAAAVEAKAPGRVRWTLCGTGGDFAEVTRRRKVLGLEEAVELPGWTSLEDLAKVYARSHCAIVPTRSAFVEGLAMTAAEAALAGRPVVTNPVVPALEILAPAAVACRTDDPQSYVDEILKLIDDPVRYDAMAAQAKLVSREFLDRSHGLAAVLTAVLGGSVSAASSSVGRQP